jgi:acyl-CoA reductase-like NAD-dependent aldehyde dehydrogenase
VAVAQTQLGEFGIVVGGDRIETGAPVEILSPFDGTPVAVVHRAGPDEIDAAIAAAARAFETTRKLPSWRRAEILERISAAVAERKEDFARTIALEAGKPIKTARIEADRAAFTFKVARGGEADLR